MKVIHLTCPNCGASIDADLENGKGVCTYCGHQILIEKEDTLEEIEAKEQSKSYGYYKGKLKAQAEAELANEAREQKESRKKGLVVAVVIGVFLLLAIGGAVVSRFSKPKVNPFACIEVSFEGIDGDGAVIVKQKGTGEADLNRIDYDISKEWDLSLGETISIVATSSEYRLSQKTKTYTVEGLDEYLKDLSDIPEDVLDVISQKAEGVQEMNLSSTKNCGYFVDMTPVKMFLLTDGEQSNVLYVVHEVNFVTEAGKKTLYVASGFENVVVREGAQTSLALSYGMYYGNLTAVESPIYITAYGAVEEVRAELLTSQERYMELKEKEFK